MSRFDNKVAIVTGGSSGMGYATAERLVSDGATVIICGTNQEKGPAAAQKIGEKAVFVMADVRKEVDVQTLIENVVKEHGRLDIIVNNAGVSLPGESDVTKYSVEDYERTMDTNMKGVFLMTKHSIPHLIKTKGTIINIASRLGIRPMANDAFVYSSSKAAVITFTKAMALSYKDKELRINCICPGGTDTPLLEPLFEGDTASFDQYKKSEFRGRVATAVEIANVVTFLASDEASYVNGAIWTVDGGSSI